MISVIQLRNIGGHLRRPGAVGIKNKKQGIVIDKVLAICEVNQGLPCLNVCVCVCVCVCVYVYVCMNLVL